MQITYSELFQFCLVVIGVIGLFIQAKRSNRRSPFKRSAITSMNARG